MAINGINGYQVFTGTDPYLQQMIGLSQVNAPVNQPIITATNPIQQDTIEISGKQQVTDNKKGLSKGAKIGLGALATAAVAGAIYFATKGKAKNLNKLFEEKMVLSNLPEKIEFQEAKTIEEGIKYAKDVLKIPNVDENFSLEAINYINKSLVDVSNAHKGKLLMPQSLVFGDLGKGVNASANHNIATNDFAQLSLNSRLFEDKFLNDNINAFINQKLFGKALFTLEKDGLLYCHKNFSLTPDLVTLLKKHLSGKPMSIKEKHTLFYSLCEMGSKIKTQGLSKEIKLDIVAPERTIYHEMGHLQDYYTNLKKLTEASTIKNKLKEVFTTDGEIAVNNVSERFLTKRKLTEEYIKNPDLLKRDYPMLYEHLYNQEIHDIAGKVSAYSQEGVGEFVAEVYARMVKGEKLSDDVIKLYEKYGGSKLG